MHVIAFPVEKKKIIVKLVVYLSFAHWMPLRNGWSS